MISSRLQTEADLHDSTMSETLSDSSSSSYQNSKIDNNRTRKFNKLRSIKLVKLPSVRLRQRQPKIQSNGESSSPNYMKTTSSSTAKDNLKKSTRSLTRRSSFRPAKSLSRLPSTKFRRNSMKKSKSIKLRINRWAEAADSCDPENAQFQASTISSKTSSKVLKKMSSLRTTRSSMKKSSHLLEKNIHRATCSSTLKDSKFPNQLEIQSGGTESEGVSALKVCPYTYCSLHGHRHATLPPLKRFVSMRRRLLKTQRSRKLERQPSLRTKRSTNAKKVVQGRETSSYKDGAALDEEDGVTELDSSMDAFRGAEKDDIVPSVAEKADKITGEIITWDEKNTIFEQIDQDSASSEEKGKDYFSGKEYESAKVADERKIEKKKHLGLWNLIYKHMATGISIQDEVQTTASETNKEVSEKTDTCGSNADNDHKQNAVKLVKEAFDKILSEIPDQSPDDQPKYISENHHEEEESSISTSFISKRDNMEQEVETKKTPSNWSNLKKLMVLKRFVKAMDKVRKFNPRKPRFLPLPTDPEGEKVHLRHQGAEEKKKSEEWMLDYALQQVISTLAPAQKRKVALLVQAFESVSPVPGNNGTSTSPSLDASSHLSYEKHSMEGELTNFGISLRKTSFPNKNSDENFHVMEDKENDVKEKPSVKLAGLANTSNDAQANGGISAFEVSEVDLEINGQCCNGDTSDNVARKVEVSASEVGDLDLGLYDKNDVANASSDVADGEVSSSEIHDLDSRLDVENNSNDVLENEQISATEVQDFDSGFSNQHDDSNMSNDALADTKTCASEVHDLDLDNGCNKQPDDPQNRRLQDLSTNEKQKNMELWYLIYKHMASGTTTLLDGPAQETNSTDLDPHIAGSQNVDSLQIKAIRMVEEAIDEIPLPDSQDEQQLETKPAIHSATSDPKEQCMNKPKQDSKKSWSNLKKMILLKRFVKALEKVKKFNPREPRFLPVDNEKEAEKVNLRHQDMEDRKNADGWMLDYTLQQVVAKLTPARKRKVQLLVEAFETVIPTIET